MQLTPKATFLENTKKAGSAFQSRFVVALILTHLVIVLPLAATLNLGTDEGFSLETTKLSFGHAVDRAIHFELQPPGYFAVLNVWRSLFGDSIFAARLFSIGCVVACLFVIAEVSKRYLPRTHTPRLVAVLSLHPFTIWCAVEIRLYAMMLLLSSLLLLFFYDGFLAETEGNAASVNDRGHVRKSRVYYGICAAVGLYTHYYTGFVLVAGCGVLLIQARWRTAFIYILNMLLVGVVFAPMLLVVAGQVSNHTGEIAEPWSVMIGLKHIVWRMQHYLLPIGIKPTPIETSLSLWAWRIVALVAIVGVSWKFRSATFWRQHGVIYLLVIGTMLFFIPLLKITGSELLSFRHTVMLFVPTVLASFAIAASIGGNRAVGWWSCAMLCFGFTSLLHNYHHDSKGGDWVRVADHISEHETPGEPVVVFVPWASVSFAYHYDGKNTMVVLPQREECETFNMHEYVLQDSGQLEQALAQQLAEAKVANKHRLTKSDSIWLITSGPRDYMGVNFQWAVLESWVRDEFEILDQREFNGSRVQHLRRKNLSSKFALR